MILSYSDASDVSTGSYRWFLYSQVASGAQGDEAPNGSGGYIFDVGCMNLDFELSLPASWVHVPQCSPSPRNIQTSARGITTYPQALYNQAVPTLLGQFFLSKCKQNRQCQSFVIKHGFLDSSNPATGYTYCSLFYGTSAVVQGDELSSDSGGGYIFDYECLDVDFESILPTSWFPVPQCATLTRHIFSAPQVAKTFQSSDRGVAPYPGLCREQCGRTAGCESYSMNYQFRTADNPLSGYLSCSLLGANAAEATSDEFESGGFIFDIACRDEDIQAVIPAAIFSITPVPICAPQNRKVTGGILDIASTISGIPGSGFAADAGYCVDRYNNLQACQSYAMRYHYQSPGDFSTVYVVCDFFSGFYFYSRRSLHL